MQLPLWEAAVSIDSSTKAASSTGIWISRSEEKTPKLLELRHCWIQSANKHCMGRVTT